MEATAAASIPSPRQDGEEKEVKLSKKRKAPSNSAKEQQKTVSEEEETEAEATEDTASKKAKTNPKKGEKAEETEEGKEEKEDEESEENEKESPIDKFLNEGYKLTEVRHYIRPEDVVTMMFIADTERKQDVELSVKKIKAGESDCKVTYEDDDSKWDVILSLIRITPEAETKGYVDQRPGVVQIIARHFLRIKSVHVKLRPFDFALCCWDIYNVTGKVICSDYINSDEDLQKTLKDLDQKSNLTKEQFDALTKLHASVKFERAKNEDLIAYLHEDEIREDFDPEYVVKFCSAHRDMVVNQVREWFPGSKIDFAPEKTPLRVRQKLEEYSKRYLQPGVHAYKRFKDLFRGSILVDDYIASFESPLKMDPPLKISSIQSRTEGNYQACYVILNINTLNFELKVVGDLEPLTESHEWYELKRNDSLENLQEFICRGITKYESGTLVKK